MWGGATLVHIRMRIPMFEGDFSQRATEEGMNDIVPQDRNWTHQAERYREATGQRTFQTHHSPNAPVELDDEQILSDIETDPVLRNSPSLSSGFAIIGGPFGVG